MFRNRTLVFGNCDRVTIKKRLGLTINKNFNLLLCKIYQISRNNNWINGIGIN